MEDPDYPLLQAIAAGSESALRELIAKHRNALFRFIYRLTSNEADAADLTAETFVRVYRNATRFKPAARVSTWIYSIAANLCRDHHRKEQRRKIVSIFSKATSDRSDGPIDHHIESIAAAEPNAPDNAIASEMQTRLTGLIDMLPGNLKASFVLHVLEERPQSECAAILGISEKAVETRVYRARQRLRAGIERWR